MGKTNNPLTSVELQELQGEVQHLTNQVSMLQAEIQIERAKIQKILETIQKYVKLGSIDEILKRSVRGWLTWAVLNGKDLAQMIREIITIVRA